MSVATIHASPLVQTFKENSLKAPRLKNFYSIMESILPNHVRNWLKERGISNKVIEEAGLHWNGESIVIPIKDKNGKTLFRKYRRDPKLDGTETDIPKYQLEKGSTAMLYNSHLLKGASEVFICEGELDCLRLQTQGAIAVSSTAGASSFKTEWMRDISVGIPLYIVYDNDEAGINGAAKVQMMLPYAKILLLPVGSGKDVTEFLKTHFYLDFLALRGDAEAFSIPPDLEKIPKTKFELAEYVSTLKKAANKVLERERSLIQQGKDTRLTTVIRGQLVQKYEYYKKTLDKFDRRKYEGNSDHLQRAKSTPIPTLIKFNQNGYAKCISHNEKTPSMKYNDETSKYPNTVKCFSCGFMGDAIDVAVIIYKCASVSDAIKKLLQ